MDCKKGGFVHACHNNLRNLEAALLFEVFKDVHLQPITGEEFDLRSSNTDDVKARRFYMQGQSAFYDIRVAHLNAAENANRVNPAASPE